MSSRRDAYTAQRDEILAILRQILIDQLHVRREAEEIDPDAPLFGTGLKLDSVDAVELWVSLDIAFGLQLVEDAGARLGASRTLNTLTDLILRHQRERGNAN